MLELVFLLLLYLQPVVAAEAESLPLWADWVVCPDLPDLVDCHSLDLRLAGVPTDIIREAEAARGHTDQAAADASLDIIRHFLQSHELHMTVIENDRVLLIKPDETILDRYYEERVKEQLQLL
jgi:hypothetical protein